MITAMKYFTIIRYAVVAVAAAFVPAAVAQDEAQVTYPSIEDSRLMAEDGNLEQAIDGLQQLLKHEPKNRDARMLLGELAWSAGQDKLAIESMEEAKRQGAHNATLRLAEWAMDGYNFERAQSLLDSFRKGTGRKAGRKASPLDEEARALQERLDRLEEQMERVEQIQVIDSVNVDAASFLQAFRLSPQSGRLLEENGRVVFEPQSGRQRFWAQPDTAGNYRLVRSDALFGNEWDTPVELNVEVDGDAGYPFMLPDGITLYYASDGPGGLGGLDIYMAREGADGFLTPVNLGMPYNSPYNDYMMAIDEVNGVGWFASDRNRVPGKVTIYLFIPSNMRTNVDANDPDLRAKALLNPLSVTWADDADYSEILQRIRSTATSTARTADDFRINVPGRGVLTRYSELPQGARAKARSYVAAQNNLTEALAHLAELRAKYAAGNESTASEIRGLENELPSLRQQAKDALNAVISAINH